EHHAVQCAVRSGHTHTAGAQLAPFEAQAPLHCTVDQIGMWPRGVRGLETAPSKWRLLQFLSMLELEFEFENKQTATIEIKIVLE
nr:hypothetical protein [Pseudomonadales bacterium]